MICHAFAYPSLRAILYARETEDGLCWGAASWSRQDGTFSEDRNLLPDLMDSVAESVELACPLVGLEEAGEEFLRWWIRFRALDLAAAATEASLPEAARGAALHTAEALVTVEKDALRFVHRRFLGCLPGNAYALGPAAVWASGLGAERLASVYGETERLGGLIARARAAAENAAAEAAGTQAERTALLQALIDCGDVADCVVDLARSDGLDFSYAEPLDVPDWAPPSFQRAADLLRQGLDLTTIIRRPVPMVELAIGKLVVKGASGAGKSTLLAVLRGDGDGFRQWATHGFRIDTLEVPHPDKAGETISLNAWDYGGVPFPGAPSVLEAIMQTSGAICLLVWSGNREQAHLNADLQWIERLDRKEARRVFIAITKSDVYPEGSWNEVERIVSPLVGGIFQIDSRTGRGLYRLKAAIATEVILSPRHSLSEDIAAIRTTVLAQRGRRQWVDIETLMVDSPASVRSASLQLLPTLMRLSGDVAWADRTGLMVLDPNVLIEAVMSVSVDPTIAQTAILPDDRLDEIWHQHDQRLRAGLLSFMRETRLAVKLDDSKYLIVSLLHSSRPAFQWESGQGLHHIRRIWRLHGRGRDTIASVIARTYRYTTGSHWSTGVYLEDGAARALIEVTPNNRLSLSVRGFGSELFTSRIVDTLTPLFGTPMVPCSGIDNAVAPCFHIYPVGGSPIPHPKDGGKCPSCGRALQLN